MILVQKKSIEKTANEIGNSNGKLYGVILGRLMAIDKLFTAIFPDKEVVISHDPIKPTIILNNNEHLIIVWDEIFIEKSNYFENVVKMNIILSDESHMPVQVDFHNADESVISCTDQLTMEYGNFDYKCADVYTIRIGDDQDMMYCGMSSIWKDGKKLECPMFGHSTPTYYFSEVAANKAVNRIELAYEGLDKINSIHDINVR